MRILFFGMPELGHIIPQLPIARVFQGRGDEVAWVAGESVAPVLAAEGMELLPVGHSVEDVVAEVLRTTGHDLMQGVTVETEAEFFAGARVDLDHDDALRAARSWQPDLIIAEHFDFIGRLVGAALDVPVASLAYGPAMIPETTEAVTVRIARRFQERGLTYEPARWYLDTCPPALQLSGWRAPRNRLALRPEAHLVPDGSAPTAASDRGRRPRVLVTFGTVYVVPEVITPILRELLLQDVDIRVTLGTRATAADFDVQSDRLEFVGFTPLAELLIDVDVVVTVGGAGTVLGSLAHGVPLVVTPMGADQPIHAERVAAAGAGISFPLGAAPDAVARASAMVLADPVYRDIARKIAAEIAAMPSPVEVAEHLAAAL
ncbi:glycosyltransferase [Kutzneria sp. NPDC051319]|uniref:glycosyltransferase n=1 Tax=Kutzneria sp. NPDC051319 TaxID=3155047 RepID=UPI00342DA4AA